MAESDEWATVETVVEDGGDVDLARASFPDGPRGINEGVLEQILSIIASINPWILLLFAIGAYYLLQRARSAVQSSSSSSYSTISPEEMLARQEAIEVARRKMQEQYDEKARAFAIKQKEKEEQLRQEKLKNLEKYGTKLGKSNKILVAESETVQPGPAKKKPEKSKLRPEYNPLMGGGSGSGACFRPARRGGAQGG